MSWRDDAGDTFAQLPRVRLSGGPQFHAAPSVQPRLSSKQRMGAPHHPWTLVYIIYIIGHISVYGP